MYKNVEIMKKQTRRQQVQGNQHADNRSGNNQTVEKNSTIGKEILNLSVERSQLVPGIINFKRHTLKWRLAVLGWDPRLCIPDEFQGDADAAGPIGSF